MAERDQLRMPLVRRLIRDDVLGAAHFCTIRIGVLSRAWLIMVSVPWRLVVAIRDHVCGEGGGRHRHGSECCNQKSFRDCGHGCSPGVDQTQENALYTGGVPDGRIYFLATVALKKNARSWRAIQRGTEVRSLASETAISGGSSIRPIISPLF